MGNPVLNTTRFCGRSLLLSAIALLLTHSVFAQVPAESQKPSSVVLVLKLVSATHVRPTTGVVISDDGLVLVPAEFVAAGDEIIVMEGGTDVVRNGRPARTIKRSVTDGLAVLAVEGLNKPAIKLSQKEVTADGSLHLSAFPPAKQMAEGAAPIWMPVKLSMNDATAQVLVLPETPLPNLSGAIIDNCGQLAGLNLANGAQSLDTDKTPSLLIADSLRQALEAMQITITPGNCGSGIATETAPTSPILPGQKVDVPVEDVDSIEPETELADRSSGVTERPTATAHDASDPDDSLQNPASTISAGEKQSSSMMNIVPFWLWLISGFILIVLLVKAGMLWRFSRKPEDNRDDGQTSSANPVAVKEPDTVQLLSGAEPSVLNTDLTESEPPDVNNLPDGFDGIILIEGRLGDGSSFNRHCMVNAAKFELVIGRGDADVCIETRSISRRHAQLQGDGREMTLSDLGSSNGTFIRGIPCLPQEIMFIEPQDEILLGDVQIHVRLQTTHGDVS